VERRCVAQGLGEGAIAFNVHGVRYAYR
jgi:hypothetical protein